MALICVQAPPVEPVSLPELKEMLRVDSADTSQDGTLASLNAAARTWVETLTQRRLVQQTWRLLLDFFPGYIDLKLAGQKVSSPFVSGSNAVLVGIRYAIVLPYPPVQSLAAFTYQDGNGNVTDMMTSPASFVQDLQSQPARLTPLFGQMWPVARVVVNAIQIDMVNGYAVPVTVTTTAGDAALSGGGFLQSDVGRPVSIPGAGQNAGCLNSTVKSVDGSGNATLLDAAGVGATATALVARYGTPGHWELCKTGIKFLVNSWFVNRMPSFDPKTRDAIVAVLGPARDLRF